MYLLLFTFLSLSALVCCSSALVNKRRAQRMRTRQDLVTCHEGVLSTISTSHHSSALPSYEDAVKDSLPSFDEAVHM